MKNYSSDNIGYLINKASRSLRWQLNKSLEKYNITSTQWSVLKDLNILSEKNRNQEATPAAIANRLNMDRPTMSGVMNRLVKNGWIKTETNPGDKRSQIINLTDKSKDVLFELEALSDEILIQALKEFETEEKEILKGLLIRIIDNLT
ncbi:transcriptional regulator, MarR family [Clostridiales bacterium oral taxon 876 str. F0540]|nr:transcriptional regulator, MarR family [Clostridiales bacterium oral taxon 876 str. F0540]